MRSTWLIVGSLLFVGCANGGAPVAAPEPEAPSSRGSALTVTCTNGPGVTSPLTFEDGNIAGIADPRVITDDFERVLVKPLEVRARGAGKALAADVQFGPGTGTGRKDQILFLKVPICKAGGTADLHGQKLTAKLYIDSPSFNYPFPTKIWVGMQLPQGWGEIGKGLVGAPIKTELTLTGTFPDNEGTRKASDIILSVAIGGAQGNVPWAATLYWDDITIE